MNIGHIPFFPESRMSFDPTDTSIDLHDVSIWPLLPLMIRNIVGSMQRILYSTLYFEVIVWLKPNYSEDQSHKRWGGVS